MTCLECGTELPEGALFCGECGAAVELAAVGAGGGAGAGAKASASGSGSASGDTTRLPTARSSRPAVPAEYERFAPPLASEEDDADAADAVDGAHDDDDEAATAPPIAPPFTSFASIVEVTGGATPPAGVNVMDDEPEAAHCPQCGSTIGADDVFCGECGFLLSATMPGPDSDIEIPPVTQVPGPVAPGGIAPPPPWPVDVRDSPLEPPVAVEPAPPEAELDEPEAEPGDPEAERAPEPATTSTDASTDALPEATPEASTEEEHPVQTPSAGDPSVDTPSEQVTGRVRPVPDPFPWGIDPDRSAEDLEATRVVAQHGAGERFVLQFSTGESVTVSGAGLIGRNPSAQPGEYVDQLVSIFDVGKSVSKTHLEFGQEGGRFWVSDRYSTNGSIVRQPEAEPRRCEPGRRYFVVRGTRIDVGEQFFVVS